MPATITPQTFVAKWRDNTLKERAAAQEHFIDLCREEILARLLALNLERAGA